MTHTGFWQFGLLCVILCVTVVVANNPTPAPVTETECRLCNSCDACSPPNYAYHASQFCTAGLQTECTHSFVTGQNTICYNENITPSYSAQPSAKKQVNEQCTWSEMEEECRLCIACSDCAAPSYAYDSVLSDPECAPNAAKPVCDFSFLSGTTAVCEAFNISANYQHGTRKSQTFTACTRFVDITSDTCATHNPPYDDIAFVDTYQCNVTQAPTHNFACVTPADVNLYTAPTGFAPCDINNVQSSEPEDCTECNSCSQDQSSVQTCQNQELPCNAIVYGAQSTHTCYRAENFNRSNPECKAFWQDTNLGTEAGKLCGTTITNPTATPFPDVRYTHDVTAPSGCIKDNNAGERYMNYNAIDTTAQCTQDKPCRCVYVESAPTPAPPTPAPTPAPPTPAPTPAPPTPPTCTGSLLQSDCDAWVAGFDALGGPGWTKFPNAMSWRLNPCQGSGQSGNYVYCVSNRISSIAFRKNLTGTLPRSGQLSC